MSFTFPRYRVRVTTVVGSSAPEEMFWGFIFTAGSQFVIDWPRATQVIAGFGYGLGLFGIPWRQPKNG